jgi:hypothetical protein
MPNWKKVIVSGSDASLNTLSVLNGITGSLFGTASFASNGGVTQLLAGPNVTLSPTNGRGQVTVSSTSGGGGFNTATGSYGSFYDTTTQTNPVGNIPRSMSLNTTDITNGVSVSGSTSPFNTYIKTENAGVYNIQFSAQLDKTDSGSDEIFIWLRKNGINLTDTATSITLTGNNGKQVAAWNWFVNSAANDYYQIIWQAADTNARLYAEPADGTPGIPSVIVTANRIDQFLSNTGSFSGSFTGLLFGTSSYALNADLLDGRDSTTFASTGSNQFNGSQTITGSFTVVTGSAVELQVTPTGVNIGNVITDKHNVTGSFNVSGSVSVSGSLAITGSIISNTNITSPSFVYQTGLLSNGGEIRLQQTQIRLNNSSNISFGSGTDANTGRDVGLRRNNSGSLEIYDGINADGTLTNRRDLLVRNITGSNAIFSGSLTVFTGSGVEFQVTDTGTKLGNLISDTHSLTGSVNITGSLNVNGGEIFAGRINNESEGGQVSFGRSLDNANSWYIDVFGNTSTPSLRFVDASTAAVRMTISGSGAVTMGQSLAVGPINPSAVAGRIDASNDVVAFSTSDKCLKENIQPIENALDKLDKIGGYTFNWNNQVEIHGYEGHDIGVIAQEIESILPEIVTTRDNGYKAVKYEKIVPFLIQCIKELKDEIHDLKSQK